MKHSTSVKGAQHTTASVYGEFYKEGVPEQTQKFAFKQPKQFNAPSRPPVPITPRSASSFSGMALTVMD